MLNDRDNEPAAPMLLILTSLILNFSDFCTHQRGWRI
jgi:hypothetical protein